MDFNFSLSGTVDPVALYAAILSSAVAVWEFIKWRQKNAIEVTFMANMKFMPSVDNNSWIIAKVINKGDTQTTITSFHGYVWKNRLDRFLGRKKSLITAFIIPTDNLPKIIEPGEQWIGKLLQNEEIKNFAHKQILYLCISHTMSKKDVVKRLKIKNIRKAP
jgi:hypothetical protein